MWCGVVWCGVVWCGAVWCGAVWCGAVWCGSVWHVLVVARLLQLMLRGQDEAKIKKVTEDKRERKTE